jgi:hypothetical protein
MAYDLVRDTMPESERQQFEGQVLHPPSPDGPWEIAALLAVGLVKGDEHLKAEAIGAFRSELRANVRADGTWRKGGWQGHFDALEPLQVTREMAKRAGIPVPEADALKGMLEAANRVRFPDGSLPGFREKAGAIKERPWRSSELLRDAGVGMLRVNGSENVAAVRLDQPEGEVYSNGEHIGTGLLRVDGSGPTRARRRVIEWCPNPDSTLMRFSESPSYPGVDVERTVVLTARYMVDIVEAHATDFGTHQWEWTGPAEYLRGEPKRDGRSVRFISVYIFAGDQPTVADFFEEGPDSYAVAIGKSKDAISTAPGKFHIAAVTP